MNRIALLFITLILVGVAFGQLTAVYYTDKECKSQDSSQTLVANLNTCTKTVGGYYSKAASCASGSFSSSTYGTADTICNSTVLATTNGKTDTCIVMSTPVSGLNSYKVMCSSANHVMSALALFVAVTSIAYI
jgi:hypothetical protein